jgi:hypothetical protein
MECEHKFLQICYGVPGGVTYVCPQCTQAFVAIEVEKYAASGLAPVYTCKAKLTGGPDPTDCDWPRCGCDPNANKVLEAISESGYEIVKLGRRNDMHYHIPRGLFIEVQSLGGEKCIISTEGIVKITQEKQESTGRLICRIAMIDGFSVLCEESFDELRLKMYSLLYPNVSLPSGFTVERGPVTSGAQDLLDGTLKAELKPLTTK